MALLSAAQIASMRATLAGVLSETAQIQRRTLTSDSAGGNSETWATIATVGCRHEPFGRRQDEPIIAERLTSVVRWMISMPNGTDAQAKDRILIGSRTFEVEAPLE